MFKFLLDNERIQAWEISNIYADSNKISSIQIEHIIEIVVFEITFIVWELQFTVKGKLCA